MGAALEDVQIRRTGGEVVVHIYADALSSGDGDIEVVRQFLSLKAAVFDPDQFFFHSLIPPGTSEEASRSIPYRLLPH